MSFIVRYEYTYEELVFRDSSYRSATERQQQNKITDNKRTISNNNIQIDNRIVISYTLILIRLFNITNYCIKHMGSLVGLF